MFLQAEFFFQRQNHVPVRLFGLGVSPRPDQADAFSDYAVNNPIISVFIGRRFYFSDNGGSRFIIFLHKRTARKVIVPERAQSFQLRAVVGQSFEFHARGREETAALPAIGAGALVRFRRKMFASPRGRYLFLPVRVGTNAPLIHEHRARRFAQSAIFTDFPHGFSSFQS